MPYTVGSSCNVKVTNADTGALLAEFNTSGFQTPFTIRISFMLNQTGTVRLKIVSTNTSLSAPRAYVNNTVLTMLYR